MGSVVELNFNIMNWKYIDGYDFLYKISEDGTIISLHNSKQKVLSFRYDRDGYKRITLCKDGVCKTYGVHRLVAQNFISNPLNKPTVNHINAIKDDNRVDNLEWATRSEQTNHLLKLGLRDMSYLSKLTFKGRKHKTKSKLNMAGRPKKN